jgi:hypothetical protein
MAFAAGPDPMNFYVHVTPYGTQHSFVEVIN